MTEHETTAGPRARLRVDAADVVRMADSVLLSAGPARARKHSRFWVLLALSGVIASAGVANDSTATVIGAMIVAPLMTPILGVAFAIVVADRQRTLESVATVLAGAALVVAIGYGFGLVEPFDLVTGDNGQIASRVAPRLIDLIAALATGLVGAFALVRSDVSDTLPGVAIAISLVPPLSVAGITLADGRPDDTLGALVLFSTNVTAIVLTATLVLLLYRVRETATGAGHPVGRLRGSTLAVVVGSVLLVAVPLGYGSQRIVRDSLTRQDATPLARGWAEAAGWSVTRISVESGTLHVTALGPPPRADPAALRDDLDAHGLGDVGLVVDLVVGGSRTFPPTTGTVPTRARPTPTTG